MREFLRRYISENFDDLLALDLKLARVLGAPAPHTLSSWAYLKSPFWTKFIDTIFSWLFSQTHHCYADYKRVTNGLQGTTGESHQTKQ